jgi:hypothetical protein
VAAAAATDAGRKEAAAECLDRIKNQAGKVRKYKAKLKARLVELKANLEGSDPDDKAAAAVAEPEENNMIPKRTAREEYVYKPSTLMF